MGKQPTRPKKQENFGKGKVTPVQVAFIVDRYLSDNNYSQTRNIFRSEASSLIAKSPLREAPKSLLSLDAMLDEYICLKEQKVMLDQEKIRVEQERSRVHTLLNGMQTAMNVYNGNVPAPLSIASERSAAMVVPLSDPTVGSSAGAGYLVPKPPVLTQGPLPLNTEMHNSSFTTPTTGNQYTNKKRAGSNDVPNAPLISKKSRSRLPNRYLANKGNEFGAESNEASSDRELIQQLPASQLPSTDCVTNRSPPQGFSVVKNLFNHSSLSPQTNSSGHKTPIQSLSPHSDKSISPMETIPAVNSSNKNTPQEITPSSCTIISSKTVIVSPYKDNTYYSMERSHCISTSSPLKTNLKKSGKRDHVKGRLDFGGSDEPMSLDSPVADATSTPESDENDLFSIDFPNMDFSSFSELLSDFDLGDGGLDYTFQPMSSMTTISGSTHVTGNHDFGSNQVMSEFSSTITEFISEKDMNLHDPDSVTAIKSITKCIKYSSPAKKS